MSKKIISESNLTTCHEYHNYINEYLSAKYSRKGHLKKNIFETQNPSIYSEQLNRWIDDIFDRYTEDINSFVTEMVQSIKNTKGDFSWLEGERIAYFAYIMLLERVDFSRVRDDILPVLKINKPCSNMRNRIDTIKQYFFDWDAADKVKFDVIKTIQRAWSRAELLKHPFKELEQTKEPKFIQWTWDYILKKCNSNNFWGEYRPSIRFFLSTTLDEKYNAIFAIHDYYFTRDVNLHKVFCIEYRRAISSKKFREREETKTINTQLKVKVKEKLDKLQYHYQYSQQRLLEMLINEHYHSIKNKIE